MAFPDKNYVLGRGKLYFAQFAPGTRVKQGGQEYFGNTPEFSTTSESENLDHFDADNGVRVKDDSVLLELNRTGAFTTDHISPKNLAKWFLGVDSIVSQGILTAVTQAIAGAQRGARYQAGATLVNPAGVRGLSSMTASVTTTTPVPLVAGVDYTVNLDTGGFFILPTTTLVADDGSDTVTITYAATTATTYNQVVSGSNAQIEGELFFEATNPKGLRFDYFYPFVQLSPDGDFQLKGDEWQVLGFTFEALKLNDTTETVYISGRAGVGV